MKAPWWETNPGDTVNLLLTKRFVKCDLYSIVLQGGGAPLRYATGDIDVTVPGGYSWSSKSIPFALPNNLGRAHWKAGTDVDVWQVALAPRPVDRTGSAYPDRIGSVPWTQAVRAGMLDGAYCQVDRAVFSAWPTGSVPATIQPTGVVTIFYGKVAEIDFDRAATILSLHSPLELLTNSMPRNVFQSGCRHTLFDAGCTLTASTFVQHGTLTAGSTQTVLNSALAAPGGSATYSLGRVVMTGGQNAGFARGVRSWSGGQFTLIAPLPFPVATGDTFDAYPGCDKTMATCTAFSNLVNFGGEPYTPSPETAV